MSWRVVADHPDLGKLEVSKGHGTKAEAEQAKARLAPRFKQHANGSSDGTLRVEEVE